MKRYAQRSIQCVLLMVAAVMWLLPINASAAGGVLTYEDFNYVENDDGETVTITEYTNTEATSVEIPQTIDGKKVTEIGSKAFYYKDDIESVVIPDTVTTIWDEAFSYCLNMKTVDMSANVETIGDYAFRKCEKLSGLELPESLTSIGEGAFHYAFAGASITIPSKITEIPSRLFDTAGVTSVDMSKCKITGIGENAFYQCFWLTSIDLPDTLTTIGGSAFWNAGLTSLTLPETVTTIGESAFSNCPIEGKVVIPAGVTAISDSLFSTCRGITSVELPATITKIGDSAFRYCSSLVSVNIPDKVTSIGTYAFNLCSKLAAIDIPEAVTSIGAHAFERCETLRSITIPEGVTAISDGLFTDCSALISVTIPDSVTSIGEAAFDDCKNLTKIAVPEKVTSIGNRAFYGCTKLTDVNIPEGVTTLSDQMFYGCTALTGVTIPDSVESMGNRVFYGCTGLADIEIPKSVKTIDYSAFYGCTALKSITPPVSVRTIGSELFAGCTSLSSVTVYPSVTSIGTNIFSNCSEDITINCQENSSIYNYAVTNSLKTKLFETIDYVIDLSDNVTISTLEAKTFTGEELTQTGVTVKMGTLPLAEGTDYTLEYENNIEAGKATMTVKGCGHFEGAQSAEFTINVLDISGEDVKVDISGVSDLTYNGKAQAQSDMTAKVGSYTLVCDKDYVVGYSDNVNVGTATIKIIGRGSCKGTVTSTFEITPADISDEAYVFTVTGLNDAVYTGKEITARSLGVTLSPAKTESPEEDTLTLRANADYEVTYENNMDVGTANVTFTGKGNYTGSVVKTFKILPLDISGESVSVEIGGVSDAVYTGEPMTQAGLSVSVNGTALVADKDYTVSYENNTEAGIAKVIIAGKGNYTGEVSEEFTIESFDISGEDAKTQISGIEDFIYTGEPVTQAAIEVKLGEKTLVADMDYTISYENNTGVGTATMTVTGAGNYKGSVKSTFEIKPIDITGEDAEVTVTDIADAIYTGSEITQTEMKVTYNGKLLAKDTDYTVTYKNNTDAGTAELTIMGTGIYTGSIVKTFAISVADMASVEISGIADKAYTGDAITQDGLELTYGENVLVEGTDYTVIYKNNMSVGTAEMTISGMGNYAGSIETTFEVTAADISSATVSGILDKAYTGTALTQDGLELICGENVLSEEADYTVSYENNISAGTAKMTISGMGNYAGSIETTFQIAKAAINPASISGISNMKYTGAALTQSGLAVTYGQKALKAGTDYSVTYKNNTNVGTAELTITGMGNYTGSIVKTFAITSAGVETLDVSGIVDKTYTGQALSQDGITVKFGSRVLKEGTDYTVTYKNNTDIGMATVEISGKGSFTGTITETFMIGAQSGSTYIISGRKYRISDAASDGTGEVALVGAVSKKLTSLNVPATVKIGGVSFKVTSINAGAFKNYKALKKVTIAGNVTTVGNKAFYGCKKLTTLTVGKNVKSIGKRAFYGCSKLKTIKISSTKLAKVGSKAFSGTVNKPLVKAPKAKLAKYKKLLKKGGLTENTVYKKM